MSYSRYGRAPTVAPPAPLRQPRTAATADVAAPTFDPAYRPPGGHSANFYASVAANNAQAKAKHDTFAAAAGPVGTRAVPVMTDAPPDAGVLKQPPVPAMGMAKIGNEVRYFPQTADSQQAKDARVTAGIVGRGVGEEARLASLDQSRQDFQAANPPLVDPRAIVADSVAYKNRAQGDAAAQNADNNRTVADSKAGMNKAHADYFNTLAPARQQELQAQATKALMQGDLAGAQAILTGEKTITEQELRDPRRNEIVAQGNNAQAGADQKNALTPHQIEKTDAEADRARHAGAGNADAARRRSIGDRMAAIRTQMGALPANSTDSSVVQRRGELQAQLETLANEQAQGSSNAARGSPPTIHPPGTQPIPLAQPGGGSGTVQPAPLAAPGGGNGSIVHPANPAAGGTGIIASGTHPGVGRVNKRQDGYWYDMAGNRLGQ